MMQINEKNINEFLEYYHHFHDSSIREIHYDINTSRLDIIVNVFWAGDAKLKDDGKFETSNKRIKLSFLDVEKVNIKELFSYDYIMDANVCYVTLNNKKYIKFLDKDNELLIISESLEIVEA